MQFRKLATNSLAVSLILTFVTISPASGFSASLVSGQAVGPTQTASLTRTAVPIEVDEALGEEGALVPQVYLALFLRNGGPIREGTPEFGETPDLGPTQLARPVGPTKTKRGGEPTPTHTDLPPSTSTNTPGPSSTFTPLPVNTPTPTHTIVPAATDTLSPTPTQTPAATSTFTGTPIGPPTSPATVTPTPTGPPIGPPTGTWTPTFTPTPTPTPLPPTLTYTPTPEGSVCGGLIQEAEDGQLAGTFSRVSSASASGGQYISTAEGSGDIYTVVGNPNTATYCFNITTGGIYRIRGWVYAPVNDSNAFHIQVDGSPADGYRWIVLQSTTFQPDYVNDRSTGADPVEVSLGAGHHNLVVYLREDGTGLDKLELEYVMSSDPATPTLTPTPLPTNPPPANTNTPTATLTRTEAPANTSTPTFTPQAATATFTPSPPANTSTPTSTSTRTATPTFTPAWTSTPTQTFTPLPPTPTPTPTLGSGTIIWPGTSWVVASPASVGMNEAKLVEARDYALTAGGSGYITRHGKLVMSWGSSIRLFDVKSVTKSIGVTALGLAVMDQKMALDDLVQPYHPSLGIPPDSNAATGWLDDITVLHLSTHTAGFNKSGGYTSLLFQPGTQWFYSDGGANWLAEALTLVYRQDLNDLMFSRVFTPLDISTASLTWRSNIYRPDLIDGIKRREFGSGIDATVDSLARIGYLYLRNGSWNNKQVIPSDFVRQVGSTVPSVVGLPEYDPAIGFNASDHYGLLWWNNADGTLPNVPRDAYWAWGLNDNLIVVIPSLDIVVSRGGTSGWQTGWVPDYRVLQPFLDPIVQSVQ